MKENQEIRSGRHCVFCLHAHLVFLPKYRHSVFNDEILREMKRIMEDVCVGFETKLVEFNGESDHVHLLVEYPPKVSISKLVNSLKGVSSYWLRTKNYEHISSKLCGKSLWSPSYFAGSCGGAPIEVIKKYIDSQCRPN